MPTITAETSAASTSPALIFPWRTSNTTANTFHDIPGAEMPWVTVASARGRKGELRCFYLTESEAETARDLLCTADIFTITYAERTSLEFTFAVDGTVEVELDSETTDHWYVQFGYRQVT